MPTQHLVLLGLAKRPNLDRTIVPARRKLFVVWTETDRATGLAVRLDRGQVVDRGCKVFQGARVVG